MRTKEELLNLELPKWPQCIVTGTKISEDQALEIIRRTDSFFNAPIFANNKTRLNEILNILELPKHPRPQEFNDDIDAYTKASQEYWKRINAWKDKWGYIFFHYLSNDWILSSMAQGCQGWCNPDGIIDYHYNIGKWPDSKEVLEEFELIAATWPFLELECSLMDDEYCEEDTHPVISFLVRNGKVEVVDPEERNIHEEFNRQMWTYNESESSEIFMKVLNNDSSDSEISLDTIRSWRAHLR